MTKVCFIQVPRVPLVSVGIQMCSSDCMGYNNLSYKFSYSYLMLYLLKNLLPIPVNIDNFFIGRKKCLAQLI